MYIVQSTRLLEPHNEAIVSAIDHSISERVVLAMAVEVSYLVNPGSARWYAYTILTTDATQALARISNLAQLDSDNW